MVSKSAQVDIVNNDRYLVYEMLGRHIDFHTPVKSTRRGEKSSGIVEKVYRNIFDNTVELTLNGKIFKFEEPSAIVRHEDSIVFVYGDIDAIEMTDDELFLEMSVSADKGETIQDILSRTRPNIIRIVTFILGVPAKRPRRTWRKSV